jgi:membrane associated rhomboid family serine protease
MRRLSNTPLAFPDFKGVTRLLILVNLASFFILLVIRTLSGPLSQEIAQFMAFSPWELTHGAFWQPFTYSLVHGELGTTFFELLSLWFVAGFLENLHPSRWVMGLYIASVLGAAAAALAIYGVAHAFGWSVANQPLYGCFGALFGLMTAIGLLHGDVEFLLFFTFNVKARFLAAIYCLVALAMLFSQQSLYAFSQLGGAMAAVLYIWVAPRRGISTWFSEAGYKLVNGYYRWKRRRAGRKFEVYMRSQGKTVRVDGYGRPIREDDPRDRSRWN